MNRKGVDYDDTVRAEIERRFRDEPCEICGGLYPFTAMQFDHERPHNGDVSCNVLAGSHARAYYKSGARAGQPTKSLSTALARASVCRYICACCHAIETHKQRMAGQLNSRPPRLAPGEVWYAAMLYYEAHLNFTEIAILLGVGRSTVRQAVRHLEAMVRGEM